MHSSNERPSDPLAAASGYLRRGWSVVPVMRADKRPLVRWEPYQEHRADEAEVERWRVRWPDANVGIVTGALSGLVVLDIDPRHDGEESLAALEARFGKLPDTVEALTGGGGRHLYFRHPGGELRNRVALMPGLDLRGDGGMVVAPPSLHRSGRRYEWEVSHHPDEMEPAPLPGWLLSMVRGDAPRRGHPMTYWRELVQRGVGEGARNNTIASFSGHLLWHGVDPEVVLELMLCWNRLRCRPPLDDDEVARTVESIRRTQQRHAAEEEG
ncbi:MAG: bifunctional DNA primase/polymerase [Alphaproteobacteria bacterium]|nr:bifunctional DNA primase/polymerase [Alphaproteobacteria bacterium]